MLERLILAKPATEMEWLMQPESVWVEPDTAHLDVVAEAVDMLDLIDIRLKFCIEGIHFERATYQVVGYRLGISKVHAWRLTKQAERLLYEALVDNPTVKLTFR